MVSRRGLLDSTAAAAAAAAAAPPPPPSRLRLRCCKAYALEDTPRILNVIIAGSTWMDGWMDGWLVAWYDMA
jgi:hypothetical protein